MPLGLARSFVDQSTHDGLMFSVESGADVVAVAVKSPRRNLVVTRGPQCAMLALANYLFAYALPVPGVNGPAESAREFARAWHALTDCQPTDRMSLRLFDRDVGSMIDLQLFALFLLQLLVIGDLLDHTAHLGAECRVQLFGRTFRILNRVVKNGTL